MELMTYSPVSYISCFIAVNVPLQIKKYFVASLEWFDLSSSMYLLADWLVRILRLSFTFNVLVEAFYLFI